MSFSTLLIPGFCKCKRWWEALSCNSLGPLGAYIATSSLLPFKSSSYCLCCYFHLTSCSFPSSLQALLWLLLLLCQNLFPADEHMCWSTHADTHTWMKKFHISLDHVACKQPYWWFCLFFMSSVLLSPEENLTQLSCIF